MISGVNAKRKTAQKGKKKKMELAKDPKQAAMAIAVVILFLGTTVYNIVAYYQSENFVSSNPSPSPSGQTPDRFSMEGQQQANLESLQNPNTAASVPQDANDIYAETLKLKGQTPQQAVAQGRPNPSAMSLPESDVEIMSSKNSKLPSGKKVLITVAGSGRSNPFLPAGENLGVSSLPKFAMLPPPEQLAIGSDANAVMGTTISGILYDKYSPSAIITIAGTDYLVKTGDVVNRYRVLNIGKDQVVVQLGQNVYKAGVGQLISQGQVNYNNISNLNKKFGGNEVLINVRKKGY